MNVLERQYGIMAARSMGEGREFVNYRVTPEFPHGGVCYNWNAAGDLKNYTGTTEQWVAIQGAIEEIKNYGTIIIATYLSANNETVRLKLNDKGDLYFIGPDGSINTVYKDMLYVEESGGRAAKQIIAGLLGAGTDAKFNDCSKYDVLKGAINYNWDKAGLLKDYDGTTWYALDAAKTDMTENGTLYLAKYDDVTLVQLQLDKNGELFYIEPEDGRTVMLRDPSSEEAVVDSDGLPTRDNIVCGYNRTDYPLVTDLGTKIQIRPTFVKINGTEYGNTSQISLGIDDTANWDIETYASAANRAGKDIYIYACAPKQGFVPVYKFSVNSTMPEGFTSVNSRKIGGFHCECADIPADTTWLVDYLGTKESHKLAGLLAGNILPTSVWDLLHRPEASPEGMLWCNECYVWVDIYLAGWDGSKLVSQFGATIADGTYPTINPIYGNAGFDLDTFMILSRYIHKRVISRVEFMTIAEGSNELTPIEGTKDLGVTGGHKDTAGRRMVSNIGCEDCCGCMWQMISDCGAFSSVSWNHGYVYSGNGYDVNARGSCLGQLYRLMMGGDFSDKNYCGSSATHSTHAFADRLLYDGTRLVSNELAVVSA